MSFSGEQGWALLRGLLVAACCLAAGAPLRLFLLRSGPTARRAAWAALLTPFFTPVLLVGYAYSNFALSLVRHPLANEAFYTALLWWKLTPLAVVVLCLAPSPVSEEAVHCRRLLRTRPGGGASLVGDLAFRMRTSSRAWALAGAIVFLLAFGEFEMASLMGIRTWTVSLFDAHAGGLAHAESVRRVLPAALIELALLAVALAALLGSRGQRMRAGERHVPPRRAARGAAWAYLLGAGTVVTLVPCLLVLRGTVAGAAAMLRDFALAGEIGAALAFGGAAALCAYFLGGWLAGCAVRSRGGRRRALWVLLLCAPGLLGPLVLSLLAVGALQGLGFDALYDGPAPLVATLCAVLLPFAVALRALLLLLRPAEPLHAAALLGASPSERVRRWRRRLAWHMEGRGRFWVLFLLFCWGYFDLTASAILAPPGMTPVTARLYNLMHYGQSAVLSAMVWAAVATPVIVLLAAGGARRLFARAVAHG